MTHQNIDQTAQQQKLDVLFRQSLLAMPVSVAISLALTRVLWPVSDHKSLIIWLSLIIVSSLIRGIVFVLYHYKEHNYSTSFWEKVYYYTLMFSVLVWGAGAPWLIHISPKSEDFIIYFYLMGLVAGALSVYSSIRYIVLSVILLLITPTTTWFLLQDDPAYFYTGLGCVIFLLSVFRSSSVLSSILKDSFTLTLELNEAKNKLEKVARTDYLTGLNNRYAFTELAEKQIKYNRRHNFPVSLILLDIDFFKKINDSKGHAAGDETLKKLAEVIRQSIRESDICGRIGGEEFAILLPNAALEDAHKVAEKLRNNIQNLLIHYKQNQFNITASIGVACADTSLDKLLHMADIAMYQAKQNGRNQVVIWQQGLNSSKPAH